MTTLSWKGHNWSVRDSGGKLSGPGPNYWSPSQQNAWVDASGFLHLTIRAANGKLYSTELDGPHLGYGMYKWVIDADPRMFTPQTVLGLFTYDNAAQEGPPYFAREMDIEFAKWSTPDNAQPIMFSVQGGGVHAVKGGPGPITAYFIWSEGRVYFNAKDSAGNLLGEFLCTNMVQKPDAEVVIMNLWHSDPDVNPGTNAEVIIRDFQFAPPTAPSGFAVGNRVKVVHTGSNYNGRTGTVTGVNNNVVPKNATVRLDNGRVHTFQQSWLQKI